MDIWHHSQMSKVSNVKDLWREGCLLKGDEGMCKDIKVG